MKNNDKDKLNFTEKFRNRLELPPKNNRRYQKFKEMINSHSEFEDVGYSEEDLHALYNLSVNEMRQPKLEFFPLLIGFSFIISRIITAWGESLAVTIIWIWVALALSIAVPMISRNIGKSVDFKWCKVAIQKDSNRELLGAFSDFKFSE